jgi:cell wall-associated protease
MKKIIVSALLVSAFNIYTSDTTEAATTAKKVPAIEAKTKKGYIKGKFDASGKALFYFDTKTYLAGGTPLKFAFDASKKATVYTSQTEYKQKDPYARSANSKKTLFCPLTWSGRQYIEVTGAKNKAFTIPYQLERLEPIREYASKSAATGQGTSLVVRVNGATKASTLSQTSRATDHEKIDSALRLEKFSYNSFIQAMAAKCELENTKGVRYVEHDQPMKLLSTDPFQSVQWALKNTGQRGGVKGADFGYNAMVKRIANKSRSIVRVAVVDTGINPS